MDAILLTIWAVLVGCFLALLVYRGQLARYEDEQLYLSDEPNAHEQEHNVLIKRLEKIEPLVKIMGGAAGLATAGAVGLYVYNAWQRLNSCAFWLRATSLHAMPSQNLVAARFFRGMSRSWARKAPVVQAGEC
jgi:hypothetical protein